ncbi:MAG: 3-isopropylmalate dehydratase small subunit, partial [Spirochaetales bacterium]|nr:3-isopropylmalate dehydratase small subunit [Spirochaetales bacterium]
LTEITKAALKPYLLEDLKLEGFTTKDIPGKSVIITRENFGCGSSREHAPWALEVNGINLVLAENFARIFKQNMFNCGMMAVELDKETIEEIFKIFKGLKTRIETDFPKAVFVLKSGGKSISIPFTVSEFDRSLVEAGGWINFADKNY